MQRRLFPTLAIAALAFSTIFASTPAEAQQQQRIGVLMLHGKNPGSSQDPSFAPLKTTLQREGWLVTLPDMPWSRFRYIDGHWDKAMAEIAGHIKTLRDNGATKIVVIGHSIGVPAALSHAARGGDVQALVLLAPGHVPKNYYNLGFGKVVRDSVDEARAQVAAGKGDTTERFNDINQGRPLTVVATAKNFLSYFDPMSDAEMGVTAPRVPATTPVMTAIGENDSLFRFIRAYYVDKLPANPKNKFLEVGGGHTDTPRMASDEIIQWIKTAVAE